MNRNLLSRLLIAVLFVVSAWKSNAQTSKDTLELLFSPKELKQLAKGDQLITKGKNLFSQLDSILIVYRDRDENSELKSHPLSNNEKDKLESSIRALRVYYVGVSSKTDVYLIRFEQLKKEAMDNEKINSQLSEYEDKIVLSKQNFQKSRDNKHLDDALIMSASAIELHKQVQEDIYNTLKHQLTSEVSVNLAKTNIDTISVQKTEKEITPEVQPQKIEEVAEKPVSAIVPVLAVTPPPIKEEPKIIKEPETYFTIQIMADRKEASAAQIKSIYSGSIKVIMNKGDDWYRYSVGKFNSYSKASSTMKSQGIKGYIVAYHNKERIPVSKAKTLLNSAQ